MNNGNVINKDHFKDHILKLKSENRVEDIIDAMELAYFVYKDDDLVDWIFDLDQSIVNGRCIFWNILFRRNEEKTTRDFEDYIEHLVLQYCYDNDITNGDRYTFVIAQLEKIAPYTPPKLLDNILLTNIPWKKLSNEDRKKIQIARTLSKDRVTITEYN